MYFRYGSIPRNPSNLIDLHAMLASLHAHFPKALGIVVLIFAGIFYTVCEAHAQSEIKIDSVYAEAGADWEKQDIWR